MKQLLIIVYKINVGGLTRQQAEQSMKALIDEYMLSSDIELKDNYIIKEIWLPVQNSESDVKVIYPISEPSPNNDLVELIEDLDNSIEIYEDTKLSNKWKKIRRELKLRKLDNNFND